MTNKTPPLPKERFTIILADPPWQYYLRNGDNTHRNRLKYPVMTLAEICGLDVPSLSHDPAYLFLWATKDHLEYSFRVLNRWGFTFKNLLVWVKISKSGSLRYGTGHWGRNCAEYVLVASKGRAKAFSTLGITNEPSVFMAERTTHSTKPTIPLLERLVEILPKEKKKIELFARNKKKGWTTWGNEVE